MVRMEMSDTSDTSQDSGPPTKLSRFNLEKYHPLLPLTLTEFGFQVLNMVFSFILASRLFREQAMNENYPAQVVYKV